LGLRSGLLIAPRAAWSLIALSTLAGCTRCAESPRQSTDGSCAPAPGWRSLEVPECQYSVELPARAKRDSRELGGGWLSTLYLVEDPPNRYIIACVTAPPAVGVLDPAAELKRMLQNHQLEMGQPVVGSGSEDRPGGGRYWIEFGGVRVEGEVHVVGRSIADLSGTVIRDALNGRADLRRVLESYRPHADQAVVEMCRRSTALLAQDMPAKPSPPVEEQFLRDCERESVRIQAGAPSTFQCVAGCAESAATKQAFERCYTSCQ
jgi:hypothetical protein